MIQFGMKPTVAKSLAFVTLSLACLSTSIAASFDCTKAFNQIDKAICTTPELSALDDQLGVAHRAARDKAVNKDQFVTAGQIWITQVRNKCQDTNCLATAYRTRINELTAGTDNTSAPPQGGTAPNRQDVSGQKFNPTEYRVVALHPPSADELSYIKKSEARKFLEDGGSVTVASVDLDQDETPEIVTVAQGSSYCGSGGCSSMVLKTGASGGIASFDNDCMYFGAAEKFGVGSTKSGQFSALYPLDDSGQVALSDKGDSPNAGKPIVCKVNAITPTTTSQVPQDTQNALPSFSKDENYGSVRQKMLGNGWQPYHDANADVCAGGDTRCQGRPEMQACAGTGMANCRFLWQKDGKTVVIFTVGEVEAVFNGIAQDDTVSNSPVVAVSSPEGVAAPKAASASIPGDSSSSGSFGIGAILMASLGGVAVAILAFFGYRRLQKTPLQVETQRKPIEKSAPTVAPDDSGTKFGGQNDTYETLEIDLPNAQPKMMNSKATVFEKSVADNNNQTQHADKNQSSQVGIFQSIATLVAIIFTGYAAYHFILFLPFFGALTSPQSELEKISIPGKSTQVEFENFKDSGGLTKNPAWHGLTIAAYQAVYNGPSKTLSGQTFSITGKATWNAGIKMWTNNSDLSTQELRQTLSKVCQVSEDMWKFTDGNRSWGTVETSNFQCGYGPSDKGSYQVSVGLHQAQNKSIQPVTEQNAVEISGNLYSGWACQHGEMPINMELFSDNTFVLNVKPSADQEFLKYGNMRLQGDRLFIENSATNYVRVPNYGRPSGIPRGWGQSTKAETVLRSNYYTEEFSISKVSGRELILKPVRLINWDGLTTRELANTADGEDWKCVRDPTVQFESAKEEIPAYLRVPKSK